MPSSAWRVAFERSVKDSARAQYRLLRWPVTERPRNLITGLTNPTENAGPLETPSGGG